jgi:ribosomal protein L7/L12
MKLDSITVATNGFVLYGARGDVHVAKTLSEAAQLAGEQGSFSGNTLYTVGYGCNDLNNVKAFFKAGQKIEALKLLRDCFSPRLGLREAKELIENLCG